MRRDDGRAWYGFKPVQRAVMEGAVGRGGGVLLVNNSLFRSMEIETRKQYVALVDKVKEDGGEASDKRPTHICIKGVFDPEMIEKQPWTVSLAQREAEFFSQVAPQVKNMIFPKGWWAGVSETQGIAIMNDLTTEGCSFAAEVAAYPVEKVMNGVEQLAGLHAQYWGQSQKEHPCRFSSFMETWR